MKWNRLWMIPAICLLLGSCETDTETKLRKSAVTIQLTGDSAECADDEVLIDGGTVTIRRHGTYRITGELTDGQICIDCQDSGEIRLLLDDVTIANDDGPGIFIAQSQHTYIVSMSGTVNTVTDGPAYTFPVPGTDEPDAAIFSQDDLNLSAFGDGKLAVHANYKTAVVSKDDLVVENGTYEIISVEHGLKGRDSVVITDGTVTVQSSGDGIKATNDNIGTEGTVTIDGGTVVLLSGDEGIQAVGDIIINGGSLTVESTNNGIRTEANLSFVDGTIDIRAADTAVSAMYTEASDKADITINGVVY